MNMSEMYVIGENGICKAAFSRCYKVLLNLVIHVSYSLIKGTLSEVRGVLSATNNVKRDRENSTVS